MGKRDHYRLVPEDDPQWKRFWDCFPRRVSKKEARKAWLQINPSPADVDRMIETLEWQKQEWAGIEPQYVPHPASWLRAERWTDERPVTLKPTPPPMTPAAAMVLGMFKGKPS